MVSYTVDVMSQFGLLIIILMMAAALWYVYLRLLRPAIERIGMVERVKMALYDKELERFCIENGVDYSMIDVHLEACYKKKHGKLKRRLEEIEKNLL